MTTLILLGALAAAAADPRTYRSAQEFADAVRAATAYLGDVIRAADHGSRSEQEVRRRALARARRPVLTILAQRPGAPLDAFQLAGLADAWKALWRELERTLAVPARAPLELLR